MSKHKWMPDGTVYRCGWCKRTLPRTPEGRRVALDASRQWCDRRTPEQLAAHDAAMDAVDVEIEAWRDACARGEKLPPLSEAARREMDRLTRYKSRRSNLPMMLALSALAITQPPPAPQPR